MMKEKVILTDCDGVLLDWEYSFTIWMRRHGHIPIPGGMSKYKMNERYGLPYSECKKLIRMFNESAAIGFLPPMRDSIYYVKKLHEKHGYIFHVITSLSNDPNAHLLRTQNLKKIFGETVFEKFIYLDTGADKDKALKEYKDTECWWIEDKPENYEEGLKCGLNGILIDQLHNAEYNANIRVKNWKEVYNLITGY